MKAMGFDRFKIHFMEFVFHKNMFQKSSKNDTSSRSAYS